jgi:hypothetical protein
MSRIRRRGHTKRDPEIPISEWSLGELRAELKRLEADPGDLPPWGCFKRKSELGNELDRRGNECRA